MTFATVPELLASAEHRFGDGPAIITTERSESFRQLARSTRSAAEALRRRGLKPGDRVLMAAPNSPSLVHAWLGAILAGGIPAAVNPELSQTELDYLRDDLQPAVTLLGDEVSALDASLIESKTPAFAVEPLEVAAIVYTSGTTSRPKGVIVRHAAYTETGASFPRWIGLKPPQRLWVCLPLFHINAQAYSLMTALAHGFGLALTPKFHASTFWRDARALEVTTVNVVGAMLKFLAAQPENTWVESSLRTIYAAPGPPPAQHNRLEARFRVRIVTGYGMSENPFGCAESVTSRTKAGSIGRPRQPASRAFENELRIVRQEGGDAELGEVGELCFRNPVMTPGYWNAPDVTAATIKDGWLYTGDAGFRDQDGDVFLTGRYKEMIRRRGENIAPAEVEDALLAHSTVRAAAVFGVPAGLMEDEVIAVVVLQDGARPDEAALKAWAATRLAAYKVPSRIHFRDSLPTTATHRVAKDSLRKEYGHAASAD
ncbi:MAG TPA: AMP-binding protein [Candidatus Dormibacteraeota bacterium]|nr:AMP-binding protein [Candidatus Dormibacteraeota bacterium]